MRQSTRLVFNTAATFVRMGLTVGMGLVATPLLLKALGQIDFGLLSVLGATGALLATVTGALSSSTQRHLAYEIGNDGGCQLPAMFNSALLLFAIGGIVVWVIGFALTPVVMTGLAIPEDRLEVAWWVYQTTLIGLLVTIGFAPFEGLIAAHQEIVISTIFELLMALARLGIIIGLFYVPWDQLLSYALLLLGARILLTMGLAAWCWYRYAESRPRPRTVRWKLVRELAEFAGWSFLGKMAWRMRQQVAVIIINVGFGPAVNAAYAVAIQVSGYASNFGLAISRAVRPAITTLQAKGSQQNVHRLVLVTGKYLFIFTSICMFPLLADLPIILDLWLPTVPEYTVSLVFLSVAWVILRGIAGGFNLALEATGNIGWWTRIVMGLTIVSLGLTVMLVFVIGMDPWVVPASTLLLIAVQSILAVKFIGARIDMSVGKWMNGTIWPICRVVLPATVGMVLARQLLPAAAWRPIVLLLVYAVIVAPLFWTVGLAPWERDQFRRMLSTIRHRVAGRPAD